VSAPPLHLWTRAFPGRPAYETALSAALLRRVAAGARPETFRLHRTDAVLAFSALDRHRPGFPRAVAAARAAGFAPVLRLAGGRAALFHPGTLAFAWSVPVPDMRRGLHARYEAMAGILTGALRRMGVDARVGAVPREYCPGDHSVNARGRRKLCGVGQRVVRGAAHVGGVVVVDGSDRVRAVLEPVYHALDLDFDPATAGSVADEVGPVTCDDVAAALRAELAARFDLVPGEPDAGTRALAEQLEPAHDLAAAAQPSRDHTPSADAGKTLHETIDTAR